MHYCPMDNVGGCEDISEEITPIRNTFGGDMYYAKRRKACRYDPDMSIGGAIATD